ncbi:hypothetical protein KEU06_19575 [Pseudaminobacter sp. 19-2017]|uniref:Uncharacterized protein n=1 Tax=Pseudaminobacter soli (ex Zhang et al. 2022) TaxID=2831468 RepID=A0A942E4H0_9HYPH|nr:hypothetical protein [Pseudaminobacter soli]MBS3650816.1 hypothetical protein [Pseudaminobacter soli]
MTVDLAMNRISAEVGAAIRRRVSQNSDTASQFSVEQVRILRKAQKVHHKQLRALRAAIAKGKPKAVSAAKERLLSSFASKLMAVVRATAKRGGPVAFETLGTWANSLSLDHCYYETVIVHPQPHGQSWRPVCTTGLRRRAQQLMVRDLLLMTVGDNPYDSTVSGMGGETRLFADIKQAISEGYYYWASLDVRDFFPSLRPGHLAGFPLSQWIVGNIVFLPANVPIRFIDQRTGIDLTDDVIFNGDDDDQPVCPSYTLGTLRSKVKQVRQGLIQGDVCAPQIARTVLGRELQHALGKRDVVYGSHLDDVVIGARSRSALKASIKALTSRLASLPAGPLDLKHDSIRDVRESAYFLGYRITRRADGTVYVRPGLDRFNRFRTRLRQRLENSTAITKSELLEIAVGYARQWFGSHPAWDRKLSDSDPDAGQSWDFVWSEVLVCVNQVIHEEWSAGSLPWTEADIDFDLLAA